MIKIKTYKTKQIKKKILLSICELKNEQWKYSLKSQIKHFKKHLKPLDFHNLLYKKKRLIGYTAFRLRQYKSCNIFYNYLLLDSIIIRKKFRNKKNANYLMLFNNKFIRGKRLPSFLICTKKNSYFFKKYYWKILNKRDYKIMDHKKKSFFMYFNGKKNKLKKIQIFFNL
mgnify:CR=1 FL=1